MNTVKSENEWITTYKCNGQLHREKGPAVIIKTNLQHHEEKHFYYWHGELLLTEWVKNGIVYHSEEASAPRQG